MSSTKQQNPDATACTCSVQDLLRAEGQIARTVPLHTPTGPSFPVQLMDPGVVPLVQHAPVTAWPHAEQGLPGANVVGSHGWAACRMLQASLVMLSLQVYPNPCDVSSAWQQAPMKTGTALRNSSVRGQIL